MYSKQEASLIRKKFWETAGQYFAPMPSAGLEKVHWINYKTGVRFISFRMHADEKTASIAIEISHPDPAKKTLYYNQFVAFKKNLRVNWLFHEGSPLETSRIFMELSDVNIYKQETWPLIISFFKEAIVERDAFWVAYREIFEMLE